MERRFHFQKGFQKDAQRTSKKTLNASNILTCILLKEEERVVYIPDCQAMLCDIFGYLQFLVIGSMVGQKTQVGCILEAMQYSRRFCDSRTTELPSFHH